MNDRDVKKRKLAPHIERKIGNDPWLAHSTRVVIARQRWEVDRAAASGVLLSPLLPWARVAADATTFHRLALVEKTLGAYRGVQHWEVAKTAALPELRRFVVLWSEFDQSSATAPSRHGRTETFTARQASGGAPLSMRDLSRTMLESTLAAIGCTSDALFANENCLKACMYAVSYTLEHALGPTRLPSIEEDPTGLRGWAAMGGDYPMTRMMLFQLMKQLHLTVHQYAGEEGEPDGVPELYGVLAKFKSALVATACLV